MGKIKLLIIVGVLLSSATSKAETICLQDVPNIGDQTCTTTYSTGTTTTTTNLISQTFNDGTWNGTMFPDSSDLNESTYLTGKDGKYAETTINSIDLMTINELRQGFTSNFTADIRWWNKWQSTVTMTQKAVSGNGDTTTQTLLLTDTTNANYQFSNYGNTLIVTPNAEYTHGTLTARFDFDVEQSAGNWNNYHSGVDVTDPSLILDYTTLTEATNTTVKFCWEFTPSTCPQAVEDIAETIVDIEDDLLVIIEDIEAPEIELPVITYEPETIEVDEPEIEIISVETFAMLPDVDTVPVLTVPVETTVIEEEITTEELIDAYDTEPVVETTTNDVPELETNTNEELPTEEVAMVEQEPELDNGEVVGEETMPLQEESAVPVSDESTEIAEEEIKEETIEEEAVEEEVKEEEVEVAEETVEETTEVNPKMVAMEEYIDSKIDNELQKIEATLTVVSELVSREMKANQVDISSYANINQAIFNIEQLPDGNKDFFKQIALVGYDRDIYTKQVSLSADDPVVKHTIELNNARTEVNTKYNELRELINARNGI
jgi:hypothetical protein